MKVWVIAVSSVNEMSKQIHMVHVYDRASIKYAGILFCFQYKW